MEVTSVLKISRAKERGAKLPIREHPFCNRLCDGGLPRPGQPVQPVNGRLVEAPGPVFNPVQNGPARPLETAVTVTVPILGPLCAAKIVEDSGLSCQKFMSGTYHRELTSFDLNPVGGY